MCFIGFAHVISHVLNLLFVDVPFMWFLTLKALSKIISEALYYYFFLLNLEKISLGISCDHL